MSSQLTNLPLNPVLPFPLPLFYPNAAFPITSFFPAPVQLSLVSFWPHLFALLSLCPKPLLFFEFLPSITNSFSSSSIHNSPPPTTHSSTACVFPSSSSSPLSPLCYQSLLMLYLPYLTDLFLLALAHPTNLPLPPHPLAPPPLLHPPTL